MNEGERFSIDAEVVETGRDLLEDFIAEELSGKRPTGHFLAPGEEPRRKNPDFHSEHLEPKDFSMVTKILTKMTTREDYMRYKKELDNEARRGNLNPSRQILLAALNNLIAAIEK